jgi:hypothetical protein
MEDNSFSEETQQGISVVTHIKGDALAPSHQTTITGSVPCQSAGQPSFNTGPNLSLYI